MRAHVVHPHLRGANTRRDPENALAECVALTRALDVEVGAQTLAPISAPRPATLLGEGKIAEIAALNEARDVGLVVVDGRLSPVQQRNLERAWKLKVIDRTGLILEIFGERAATREGVLQVELAHLSYQKTRLVRSWTHLERQRGGAGFLGGPGETQIEADRRAIDEKIARIRRQLEKVARTRELHRKTRRKAPWPVVALVGYTNAGKSTLFNLLTESGVLARDMLFATLDPTMRMLDLPGGARVILSDTVGFVSELPTQLVAAFRATLEEVLEADVIVHVRDLSHPETEAQKLDVLEVLAELNVAPQRLEAVIEARNKIDMLAPERRAAALNEAGRTARAVALSARSGEGVAALLAAISGQLTETRLEVRVIAPHADGRVAAWLHAHGAVRGARELAQAAAAEMEVSLTPRALAKFCKLFPDVSARPGDAPGEP